MVIAQGVLQLRPADDDRGQHLPIDHFFRSLAEDQRARGHRRGPLRHRHRRHRSALQAIKAEGGITFAQDDDGAARRHAAQRHRRRLRRLRAPAGGDRPRARAHRAATPTSSRPPRGSRRPSRRTTSRKSCTSCCNAPRRRLHPLQVQHHLAPHPPPHGRCTSSRRLGDYLRVPAADPGGSRRRLYQDILIQRHQLLPRPGGVRGAQAQVLPAHCSRTAPGTSRSASGCRAARPARRPTRWRSPCSSSPRTTAQPRADPDLRHRPERAAIEQARAGVYPKNIALDVSPERLRRFFVGGGRQLPDQQVDPRHVRLRPAQRAHRPAVLAARPDQLPQRADLPGAGAAAEGHAASSTTR